MGYVMVVNSVCPVNKLFVACFVNCECKKYQLQIALLQNHASKSSLYENYPIYMHYYEHYSCIQLLAGSYVLSPPQHIRISFICASCCSEERKCEVLERFHRQSLLHGPFCDCSNQQRNLQDGYDRTHPQH